MNAAPSIDDIDKQILSLLQQDASISVTKLAKQVGLSHSPCWLRLKRLARLGIIKKRVAILDPHKLGLGTTVFVSIQIGSHSREDLAQFIKEVAAMDEVLEFHRLAGEVDFGLRVVVADTAAFDALYRRLVGLIPMKAVTSRFVLESIKSETAVPVPCG